MAKTYVQACPNCGSTKFHQENDNLAIFGDRGIYVCDRCGFSAKVFPEVEVDRYEEFVKDTRKKKVKRVIRKNVVPPLIGLAFVIVFIVIGPLVWILYNATKPRK